MGLSEEHLRILRLIESGQVTAEEGARLIEALGQEERARPSSPPRFLRIRVTDLSSRRNKIDVTIPISLIGIGLKLGARLAPQSAGNTVEELMRAIESGSTGRIREVQDLEEGERIEIFIE